MAAPDCRCSSPSGASAREAGDFRGERVPGRVFDPDSVELRELRAAADFRGARVLEIGVGGGRLSSRYAAQAAQVVGVDLSASSVSAAHRSRPVNLEGRVHFHQANALHLPFRGGTFDIALLGWSL